MDLSRYTGIPLERMRTIFNPSIPPQLEEKAGQALDHAWFSAGEAPVVLGVGRLTRQKDFGTLIEAFARLRKTRARASHHPWRGRRTPATGKPGARITTCRRCRFAGVRPEPVCLYAQGGCIRALIYLGGTAQQPDRGPGLWLPGRQHRLPQRTGGNTGWRKIRAPGADGQPTGHGGGNRQGVRWG